MQAGDRHAPFPDGARSPTRRGGVVAQVVEDQAVLLDIESGHYFSLNPVGSRIWELCDGTRTLGEMAAVICEEFDVVADVATLDIVQIVDELKQENLVLERE